MVIFFGGALARINVHNPGKKFAARKLQDQFRSAARGHFRHFRIGAAAKARAGFRVQLQKARGPANGDGIKPGALDQNIFRGKGNFGFGAAHDAADAHGTGTVTVADQGNGGIQRALDAVERFHFFARLGLANHDAVIAHKIVVVGMQGMPQFQHHVVGNVDHVVDAGHACGFQAILQPRTAKAEFSRREPPAR